LLDGYETLTGKQLIGDSDVIWRGRDKSTASATTISLSQKQQRQAENHETYKEGHHRESHHSAETDAGYGQDR
jgi:hypothetical protein